MAWWKLEAKKGDTVYIEGEINYSEDKKAFIKANTVKVLSGYGVKKESNNEADVNLPF